MDTKASVGPLTDLYQLVCDSIKGYGEASDKVKNRQLSAFVSHLVVERLQLKHELSATIRALKPGEDLDQGTLKGDLHRAWLSIREALSGSTDASVLPECARGEEYLNDRYESVIMDKALPADVLQMLRVQLAKIAATRSTIEQLGNTVQYDKA